MEETPASIVCYRRNSDYYHPGVEQSTDVSDDKKNINPAIDNTVFIGIS